MRTMCRRVCTLTDLSREPLARKGPAWLARRLSVPAASLMAAAAASGAHDTHSTTCSCSRSSICTIYIHLQTEILERNCPFEIGEGKTNDCSLLHYEPPAWFETSLNISQNSHASKTYNIINLIKQLVVLV